MSRIFVIGATGLIGSHVVAALLGAGHEVTGAARCVGPASRRLPGVRWRAVDLARASAEEWRGWLAAIEVVVNCAGALQSGPADDITGTHARGLAALVAGCESAGVRRVIHFSAIGVDRQTPTEFSRSKRAGDEALMAGRLAGRLEWVILRPSLVLGRPAYGASALIRGLAALPVRPVMPDSAPLQPVVLDDVVATVLFFVAPATPARVALELAGPERFDFDALVALYRRWLGHDPALRLKLPRWAAGIAYALGDLAGLFGWRPPVRSTARREIARGAMSEGTAWTRLTGIVPQSMAAMLQANPASVQEGWFAGLYLLKPLLLASLTLFWMGSGLASLGPGYGSGLALLQQGGADMLAAVSVLGGGVADLGIGVGLALRRSARLALLAGLALALLYVLAGSVLTPWLWLDPLAPLLKIAPVSALHLVALATLRDR